MVLENILTEKIHTVPGAFGYASVKLSMLTNVTIDDHDGINVISPMGRCRGKQYQVLRENCC